VGLRAYPLPLLPLCGQLTRCFSAVAELLVTSTVGFLESVDRTAVGPNPGFKKFQMREAVH